MAKKTTKELSTKEKLQNKVSGFFESNLKLLLIIAAALFVVVLAVVIISSATSKAKENAMIRIQELEDQVTGYAGLSDDAKATLLVDLTASEKGMGYVSVKASYLKGVYYFNEKQWQNAYDSFMASIDKDAADSYFAPLALVNAAAAQEELGNLDKAVELYTRVTNEFSLSGVGAKALFNTGRIYYQQGKTDLASSVFNQLVDKYPSSEYSALAKDITVLM